jgi:IS30 family transposase
VKMDDAVLTILKDSEELTKEMRQLQNQIMECNNKRRELWHKASTNGISYSKIAENSGVVKQTVYNELRKRKNLPHVIGKLNE